MMKAFITIEGNDGSGKSTVIEGLKKVFAERGVDVVFTREPGGSAIAEQIRGIILDPKNTEMDDKTEALLYAASRRQHLRETVLPALEQGKLVICDRFIDSSLAYQGHARGIGIEEVYDMNMFATSGMLPDLTLYILVSPEVGLSRKTHQKELDRLELETNNFHKTVYEGYLKLVERFPERVVLINGEKTKEEVLSETLKVIDKFLNK
ncbi:MAG: dTMP kinase [Bacilli bacterium]|nr:dTMP kinase [Bacilli bacterium]